AAIALLQRALTGSPMGSPIVAAVAAALPPLIAAVVRTLYSAAAAAGGRAREASGVGSVCTKAGGRGDGGLHWVVVDAGASRAQRAIVVPAACAVASAQTALLRTLPPGP